MLRLLPGPLQGAASSFAGVPARAVVAAVVSSLGFLVWLMLASGFLKMYTFMAGHLMKFSQCRTPAVSPGRGFSQSSVDLMPWRPLHKGLTLCVVRETGLSRSF